jgi:dihydrofolate synthase/folylpolyglutamate synthase
LEYLFSFAPETFVIAKYTKAIAPPSLENAESNGLCPASREAIAYINSLAPTLEHPSLKRITQFLAEEGDPQNRISTFHIGGTNGKGSTVAILESLLREGGAKVGSFTGPHLMRWHERFRIQGRSVKDKQFGRIATLVRQKSCQFASRFPELGPLTWFEFLTAMAFFLFLEEEVDFAVVEVGLGGRFDATNVLAQPLCSCITNVSLDHMQILGSTVEAIAFEKAGIIKPATPIVTAAKGEALEVITTRAKQLGSPITVVDPESISSSNESSLCASDFVRQSELLSELSLVGDHQRLNALCAVQMLIQSGLIDSPTNCQKTRGGNLYHLSEKKLNLSKANLARGLQKVYWPGRFHWFKQENLILDGAHNLAGIETLRNNLSKIFPQKNFRFLFGCYENKNGADMLRHLLQTGDSVIITTPLSNRSGFATDVLAKVAQAEGVQYELEPDPERAVRKLLGQSNPENPAVVAGSFTLVKLALLALGWHTVEDGL